MAKPHLREQARELRRQGLSIREIMNETGASKGSISMWVRDIPLTKEQTQRLEQRKSRGSTHGQREGAKANRRYAMEKRKAYQEAGRLKAREGRPLHAMGCMLYWAEGAKGKNTLNFVNSDTNMMRFYIRFLREELNVHNHEIALHIICHSNDILEVSRIEQFWLDLFQLPPSCLRKTVYKVGSNSRHNILTNGVCSIRVYKTELVQHVYGAIQEYAGFDYPEWLF